MSDVAEPRAWRGAHEQHAQEEQRAVRQPAQATKSKAGGGTAGLLWLTWRQHRWMIVTGIVITGSLIGWMLMTYGQINSLVRHCGNTVCADGSLQAQKLTGPHGLVSTANYQMSVLIFLPLIFGLFWGVPLLAREHEQRTLSLAWSQDVSPSRWLFGKLAILGVLVAALTAAACAVCNRLAGVIHVGTGASLFDGTLFQAAGWLPLALAVAWFTFGVAAGALTRRTTTALAITLAAFIGRGLLMAQLRPHFMTPLTALRPIDKAGPGPAALLNDSNALHVGSEGLRDYVDAAGQHYSADTVLGSWCPPPLGRNVDVDSWFTCLQSHHLVGSVITYQPGSRLGTFHLIEAGIYLGLAIVCVAITWVCVRAAKVTT
ncbi:MAG: hypothetical protein QOJ62_293 [Actinomycetota bacterium]|nr:hypothetical protein [Actinomycetota bacterium]